MAADVSPMSTPNADPDANGNLACQSGKLVRLSIQAASIDIETTPMTRLFLHAYMSETKGTYGQPDFQMTHNTVWFDIHGALQPL